MNKDFHYYGTYYAARFAGYSREDAEEIAWAAQMVDDFTKNNFGSLFSDKDAVYTCESLSESMSHSFTTSDFRDLTNEELQTIRRIWVPFHFLPGNLRGELLNSPYNLEVANPDAYANGRNLVDFRCICAPNSDLVKEMIKRVGAITGDNRNIAIGIAMHVMADTWAHQLFVGSPNYYINEVENVKNNLSGLDIATPPGVSYYSVAYLGHGRIGHSPDYGFADYSYRPMWAKQNVAQCNRIRFFNAFAQMVDVLEKLRLSNIANLRYENYVSKVENIPASISEYSAYIQGIFEHPTKDQSSQWIETMRDKCRFAQAGDYSLNKFGNEKLKAFESEARAHMLSVISKVNLENHLYFN